MHVKYLQLGNDNVNYISQLNLEANDANQIDSLTRGFIVWEIFEACLIIKCLRVNKKYEHKGYGTLLLNHVVKLAKSKNIDRIELDDMSDNAWKLDKNIYIKSGFTYKHAYPYPEMEMIVKKL